MTDQDDKTLQLYVDESLEQLADIENNLLAIEEAGAEIDEELVNKVFRAAHSIKGGAGFVGLTNIKDLSHKMEDVLGMVRSRGLVPNPEIINILLLASDALRNLINNVSTSNEIDVSEHIEGLSAITKGPFPHKEKEVAPEPAPALDMIDISFPAGKPVFTVAKDDISKARKERKYIYLVEIDLNHDVRMKEKTPHCLLDELQSYGIVLASKIDENEVAPSDNAFVFLFACILEPDDIDKLLAIDHKHIFELTEDLTVRPITQVAPLEPAFSEKEEAKLPAKDALAESTGERANRPTGEPAPTETSLRVHVSLLDSLMNLAGELVLSRNQLLQAISLDDHHDSEIVGQKIDLITSELQEAIMRTRMQPIGNVFNKFPRVVRDLARGLGKDVELALEGKDVELDKSISEAINDPLTHLVRNAVGHGIEGPDERQKAGKNPKGKIVLKAYHEAGLVYIEITDDGKGLDGNKLAAAAVAKGLITEVQSRIMSEKEKVSLIFLPGFSMAEKVTDVSGRGVGMDVVKTNLDKLGGQTEINSQPGKGTMIRIKLPLTLAIIPSQIILTEGERYAIPQVNLEELLRVPADQVKHRIEVVGDAQVVRLRGKLLPLVRLADVIGVERHYLHPEEQKLESDQRENIADRRSRKSPLFEDDSVHHQSPIANHQSKVARRPEDRRYRGASAYNIVVVSTGAMEYGLIVDKLLDSEEIVIKPLGRHLKSCKGYAGATIMGDGLVALILDVSNLARMAGLVSVEATDRAIEVAMEAAEAIKDREGESVLIFRSSEDEQFAVPLNQVKSIEKIRKANIEEVGGKKVIQYRGRSLGLFTIDEAAQVKSLADKEDLLVIVLILAAREIGLLATGPVEATDISIEVDDTTFKQPGILGSAILDGHTTLFLDVFDLVCTINPEWVSELKATRTPEGETVTILVVEDSDFFRNQVKDFVEAEGYNVITAEDGMIAWGLLEKHADEISLVVTDLEMPNLDGLGLTKKIKADARYSDLPVIALTSLAGDEDIARGKEAGVDEYQIKLDREKLVECVRSLLNGERFSG